MVPGTWYISLDRHGARHPADAAGISYVGPLNSAPLNSETRGRSYCNSGCLTVRESVEATIIGPFSNC